MPVYNVQNYLAACVKSVAEQPGRSAIGSASSWMTAPPICQRARCATRWRRRSPACGCVHRENGGLARCPQHRAEARRKGRVGAVPGQRRRHGPRAAGGAAHASWPPTRSSTGSSASIWSGSPTAALTEHAGLRLVPGPFDSERLRRPPEKRCTGAGHWSVWKYCIRRAVAGRQRRPQFWADVRLGRGLAL